MLLKESSIGTSNDYNQSLGETTLILYRNRHEVATESKILQVNYMPWLLLNYKDYVFSNFTQCIARRRN